MLRREGGMAFLPLIQIQNLLLLITSVCNCGAAKDEMKGNLSIFSFLTPTPIQSLLSIHSVSVC